MQRLLALLLLLAASSAHAHDFWIEPSSYAPAAGEIVSVRLRVGEQLQGEPVPRRSSGIERFFAHSTAGDRDVVGQDGRDPAGLVAVRERGTTIVAYRSLPSRVELDAAKFEGYLRDEGLDSIIEQRKARGESAKRGIEIFSRAAKTLLQVGDGDPVDQPLGLRLEVVRASDGFQVLFEGKPLANALVTAMRRGDVEHALHARTDDAGRVTLAKLERGEWLVETVHMVRAPADAGADWESIWASVTFAVR